MTFSQRTGQTGPALVVDGGAVSQPRTVLLADDDDDFRETLRLWLADDERWEIREAVNGAEVLDKLDETVDILVLDRQMPEVTGSEVIERLGETPFEGAVVVLTAYRSDQQLSEDDVEGYVIKPIDRDEFIHHLEQRLQ